MTTHDPADAWMTPFGSAPWPNLSTPSASKWTVVPVSDAEAKSFRQGGGWRLVIRGTRLTRERLHRLIGNPFA